MFNKLLLFSGTLLLAGCTTCENCIPPSEAVSELTVQGVTLTPLRTPFPDTVKEEYVTLGVEHSLTADLDMYFSPADGFETIEEPYRAIDRSRFPYEMVYSQLVDGSFVEIMSTNEFDVLDPNAIYSGETEFHVEPENLLIGANHVLKSPSPFEMPARATHVELWFRENLNSDPILVRRVAVDNLIAYRMYLQPLLPNN